MRTPLISALLLSLSLSPTFVAPLHAQRPTDAEIRTRAAEYLSRLERLGYSGGALVVRGGTTVFMQSVGMADRAAAIRADANTVYSLGSITKQFTAAAILRLEEQGKLRTTDSLARFFPDAPVDKRAITLHHLLTHTAGFRSDYSPSDYEATTRDEYVKRMFDAPLRTKPGAAHFYANAGYSLLAAIVELVTQQDYEDALYTLVLTPAGMLETGYKRPAWPAQRVAHGTQNGKDWGTILERINTPGAPYWELRGNGGLHTTLGDIAKWDAALSSSRVFTDSSRRKFMTGYVNEGPAGLSKYAYGWAVSHTSRGTTLVQHNGGNGVYVAELLRFVDDSVTVFMTSTNSEMTATPAVLVLSRIALGQPYTLPPARVAIAATVQTSVAGRYVLSDGSQLNVTAANGKLFAEAIGQQAFQLVATGDTASSAKSAEYNTQSRAIVERLLRGDIGLLRHALGPGADDSATVAQQEAQLLAYRKETFGEFQSIDVLGTAPSPEGALRTTVRVNYARGGATNLYTWDRDGTIMDIGARPYQPVELAAALDGDLHTVDERAGSGARFRDVNGALTAITPRGAILLKRAAKPLQ